MLPIFIACLLNISGAGCCGSSGGGATLPEAASVFVPPAFAHMCASQHTPGSPGSDQTQTARGAEEGEQSKRVYVDASLLWKVFTGVVLVFKQQAYSLSAEEIQIVPHPCVEDVLLLPVDGPRYSTFIYAG